MTATQVRLPMLLLEDCSGYLSAVTTIRQSWQPSPRTLIWLVTAYGAGFRHSTALSSSWLATTSLKDKDAVTGNDAATLFIVQVVGNGPVTVEP